METRRIKTLWVKDVYLNQILQGEKTIEVRVGYKNILRLQPGDLLRLNDRFLFRIKRVAHYRNFEELLAHEDPACIAPGMEMEELERVLREIYPPEKEALGVVALELVPEDA